MKIVIAVGHPKDVHLWKNIIPNLEKNGHEVIIAARDKDVALYLLQVYRFKYEIIGSNYNTLIKKAYGLLESNVHLLKLVIKFKPDILIGGGPYFAYVSKLIKKPHIDLWDTESANLHIFLTLPFSDVIVTPNCFKKKINLRKHITFNGYQELAYLHPKYFKPNPSVLDDLKLAKDDPFFIMRFVSWNASHDSGQHGFTNQEKFVKELENFGRVFITSEQKLDKIFEKYRLTIPAEKMHDLLYYATMYIGEGATMASESAILGTPAIYVNTQRLGYLDELEEKYDLVYTFSNPKTAHEESLIKAIKLLEDENLKKTWQKKRVRLLSEKIDVTKFITELIENYQLNKI